MSTHTPKSSLVLLLAFAATLACLGAPALAADGGSSCANATLAGFSPALPDCRAYELVSSAAEIGEVYVPGGSIGGREQDINTARPFRAATDGDSVAYLADPGALGGDGSSAKGKGNEYLARRGAGAGPEGWESADITPPVGLGENASYEREYEAFSPDLSKGIVTSEQPLLAADPSPQGPVGCNVLYAEGGDLTTGSYSALFTETLEPGWCGEASHGRLGLGSRLVFAGEAEDHSQRFFQTPAALVAPAVGSESPGSDLYDAAHGSLSLVNRLPDGEVATHATYGGPSNFIQNEPDFSNAIAHDGSRAFWSIVEEGELFKYEPEAVPVALYAREDPSSSSATTIQLDLAQGCAGCTSGRGQFWTASSDGSKVFFTDCNRLTADSTANASEGCQHVLNAQQEVNSHSQQARRTGNDLYEYDFARPIGERLVDLTVDHNAGDRLGADVQGVVGSSADGSYVYFVAGGALEVEPNDRGEAPTARKCESAPAVTEELGQLPPDFGCNLYVEHDSGRGWERPQFVAALDEQDLANAQEAVNDPDISGGEETGDLLPNVGSRTAEVTPDGRHLVFESTQDLTGYDTGDVALGGGLRGGSEVFVYDAETHRLMCASCNPTGAPPLASIQNAPGKGVVGYAPYLPVSSSGTFMHRWVNAQGTEVFFDSSQPLATGDSNGTQDVYEWEAEGAAGCPQPTSIYGGCVFLLSGGESPDWSFLVDADENGENIFLVHRGPLGGAGPRDDKFHLYDVRAGGGFAVRELGCTGTGCQGVPPAAPIFATPASATFAGIGNFSSGATKTVRSVPTRSQKLARVLKACRKQRSRARRRACEKRARHRHEAALSRFTERKSSNNGRNS